MIIAFVCGTLFGLALSAGFAVLWARKAEQPKTVPVQENYDAYIAQQWRNLAIYDGTEKGQQELIR